jgi:hypothetical protein
MWFYMKYIVKNHSDRILLARLCSYGMTDISQVHDLNTKLNFECQKYNTMIVHLKTNNLSLCLNHEHLKSVLPKIIT